jgi:hypothetical protein
VRAHPSQKHTYGAIDPEDEALRTLGCEYGYERGLTVGQLANAGFPRALLGITAPPGLYTCAPFHVTYHDRTGTIRTQPVAGERFCR